VSAPHDGQSFLPQRWKELAPLLDAVLEREPHERRAFLDRACADDTDLRAEIDTLLEECAHSDRLFSVGAMEQFATLLTKPRRGLPETVAERYRIGREIGTGGMATVYLARDLKHDRDVALKVVRALISPPSSERSDSSRNCGSLRSWITRTFSLSSTLAAPTASSFMYCRTCGASLRAKLEREPQLSLEDALSINRQVAAAPRLRARKA
jgi:serine/threonine-protein kinase